jgi:hypothetical protein
VLLEEFELTDFARKVVGVGSVGTRAWIAMMHGRDGQSARSASGASFQPFRMRRGPLRDY